jgi:hypothetical protein
MICLMRELNTSVGSTRPTETTATRLRVTAPILEPRTTSTIPVLSIRHQLSVKMASDSVHVNITQRLSNHQHDPVSEA